jgi:phospholipid-translocating ATPase
VIYLDGNIYPLSITEPNVINNSKYTWVSFLPLVLYHQFRYFFNFFFLVIALSQFISMLKVGFLFTYIAPLLLVLGFTLFKEAYDDHYRKKRDEETNNQVYTLIEKTGTREILSRDLKVGQVIEVKSNQRIPADLVILSTDEEDGTVFIRTDQLDGETDWKLRKSVNFTHQYLQNNSNRSNLIGLLATVKAEAPKLDIYNFEGVFKVEASTQNNGMREGLNLENTLWGNCFLANSRAVGLVVYAGREMRSVMNAH